MPLNLWISRLIQVVALTVVAVVAMVLAVVLAVFSVAVLAAGFALHKLGWDRPLLARLGRKLNVRVATLRFPDETPEADAPGAPIEARWTLVEERRPD